MRSPRRRPRVCCGSERDRACKCATEASTGEVAVETWRLERRCPHPGSCGHRQTTRRLLDVAHGFCVAAELLLHFLHEAIDGSALRAALELLLHLTELL